MTKEWLGAATTDSATLLESIAGAGKGSGRGSGSSRSNARRGQGEGAGGGRGASSLSRLGSGALMLNTAETMESDDEELDRILQSYESKDGEEAGGVRAYRGCR